MRKFCGHHIWKLQNAREEGAFVCCSVWLPSSHPAARSYHWMSLLSMAHSRVMVALVPPLASPAAAAAAAPVAHLTIDTLESQQLFGFTIHDVAGMTDRPRMNRSHNKQLPRSLAHPLIFPHSVHYHSALWLPPPLRDFFSDCPTSMAKQTEQVSLRERVLSFHDV